MSEDLHITRGNKEEQYTAIVSQGQSFAGRRARPGCQPGKLIGNIERNGSWMALGQFYLVKEDELVLGPFQGPNCLIRHVSVKEGAFTEVPEVGTETLIVPDVEKFPVISPAAARRSRNRCSPANQRGR